MSPQPEVIGVLDRRPDEPGDHLDRQVRRELRHEVTASVSGEPVNQSVAERPDLLLAGLHQLGRERLLRQSPEPRVIGRVE